MNIFTRIEENQIVDMYNNDMGIDYIVKHFNTHERDIRRILKEQQIDRKYNSFTEELYERMELLYSNGATCKYIANTLLVAESSVTKILRKRNVHIRTWSESNRKYSLDENYFDVIDTPNKAYLVGLLYADGCNHEAHHSVTLSLQEEDKNVVEFMRKELSYGGPIRINKLHDKNEKYKNQHTLCINSVYLSNKLKELGVINAKSLILTFPEWLNEQLYPHFIRGYFDGDGCVYYDEKHNKCTTQTVGTFEFCNKLSEIFNSIGCKHYITHPKQSKSSNTFIIRTGGNKSSLLFLDYIYNNNDFHMNRKYQKYLYFKEKYLTQNNTQVA